MKQIYIENDRGQISAVNNATFLAKMEEQSNVFAQVSKKLKDDRAFVVECIEINPNVYRYISKRLQEDKEIINMVANSKYPYNNVIYTDKHFDTYYGPTMYVSDPSDTYHIER